MALCEPFMLGEDFETPLVEGLAEGFTVLYDLRSVVFTELE